MAVYLPSAIVGNSRVLATVGFSGEIMALFYPNIDFAQNVHECMPAVYVGEPGRGAFHWTFGAEWSRHQQYMDRANVLETELELPETGLRLLITDFVLPDSDVVVRAFEAVNTSPATLCVTVFQYADLSIGEVPTKNSVRYVPKLHAVVQYRRDIALVAAGDFEQFECAKADPNTGPKAQMTGGTLNGQVQDIGDVAFALGWPLSIPAGGRRRCWMVLGLGSVEAQAYEAAQRVLDEGFEAALRRTRTYWEAWLDQGQPPVPLNPSELRRYERGLLAIKLLHDEQTGAFIAAPEFDPGYERSGGYGFCWPRDAAQCVHALQAAGVNDMLEAFFRWCARTQQADGLWGQRYWTRGDLGPSWCLREGFDQLDQGAMVIAEMSRWVLTQDGHSATGDELWKTIERGVAGLLARLNWDGLHDSACDVWESFEGTFTYTNAAIYAALRQSARVAESRGLVETASRWRDAASSLKAAVMRKLWLGDCFARGLRADGTLDETCDSSVLGVIWPFELLDPGVPRELEMAVATVEAIQRSLLHPAGGILRYEGEHYLGGMIGCVNTLWLARCLLLLAHRCADSRPADASRWAQRAREYIRFCEEHTTPTGLVSELIGTEPSTPYWAAPHAWATALHITCLLALV